jgi:hypothetical protein
MDFSYIRLEATRRAETLDIYIHLYIYICIHFFVVIHLSEHHHYKILSITDFRLQNIYENRLKSVKYLVNQKASLAPL